jgi:hypothetical protein
MLWLVVGAWRLRRRRVTPGAAAAGMMHELLSEERRAAIEVIVEERTGYRDPEDRDGNFLNLADWKTLSPQTTSDGAAEAAPPRGHRLIVQKEATRMARVSSSFYRGMIAGIMAWAVVWGVGALLADMTSSVPSYIRLAAIVNVAIGLVGFSALYWREQRGGHRALHP